MKILSYEVHNVMKIGDFKCDLEGHHLVMIGGKNGQGKTSAIRALLMALCGRSGMDWPDVAMKEKATKGWVRVSLSGDREMQDDIGFTVELRLVKKRGGVVAEEIRVLDSTGEEAPSPRELLKRLFEYRAFDPLSFERCKPKERADILRKLVGLDFSDLEEARKETFDERTSVNRDLKNAKAKFESIVYDPDAPDEKVVIKDLLDELNAANEANKKTQAVIDEHADLAAKLEQYKEEVAKLEERLANGREVVAKTEEAVAAKQKECAGLVFVDTAAIEERLHSADATNEAVAAKHSAKSMEQMVLALAKASDRLTTKINNIDQEKQERLENAKWPLPGMTLDESGVLLDGLPFEQASKAQRVMASVKVGIALNPKLRLLVCEDGNDLDLDTLDALQKELEANDFQMILEFVTRSQDDEDRCCVVFQDGVATGSAVSDTPLLNEDDGEIPE